jgi:type IV fimbrial biogenesis protein FimT
MMAPPVPRVLVRSPRLRGFTLAEVLVVMAMISVLVVAASPTFVKLLRDRRVNRAGMQLVDYLRTARTMAIGRGLPMLFTWNATGTLPQSFPGGTGSFEITEPIVQANVAAAAACAPAGTTPGYTTTCNTTLWHTACTQIVGGTGRPFDIQNGAYNYTAITFYEEDGITTSPGVDFCFSPTGRMYGRVGPAGGVGGAFAPVLGVPRFAVFNLSTNPTSDPAGARWVYVLPNGVARLRQ